VLSNRTGITLVELVVVLVVMGLGTALIAPALIFPEPSGAGELARLLSGAVQLAATREQTVELVVEADGRWRIPDPAGDGVLAEGRLQEPSTSYALRISPLGSCGPTAGSDPPFALDLLTCEVR
jgi:hypothetical protein